MRAARDPLYPGATLADRYTLVSVMASGADSSVWSAVDGCDGDAPVAVTILSARSAAGRQRLSTSDELGARLAGPHFVRTLGRGVHEGRGFLVEEKLEGETLEARLDRYGPMGAGECLRWLADLASAIGDARAAGVEEIAIAPKNLFFARSGRSETLKLVDLASPAPPAGQGSESREMWAIATMLYRAITGVRPFDGSSQVLPPSVVRPGLAPALDAFFRHALSPSPERRFRSLDDLVLAFEEAAVGNDAPSLRPPRVPSDSPAVLTAVLRDTRRRPWSAMLATVLSIAIIVLAIVHR